MQNIYQKSDENYMINFDEFEKHSDGEMVSGIKEGRYIAFYEDDDSVTLDGSFTVEELQQLIERLRKDK